MSAPTGDRPELGGFVTEHFCDEVYDYVDDNLAEAMDEMEKELLKAAPKAGAGAGAADHSSVEDAVKVCCDNVQKRLQKEFDRNLDIFDRYVKKNVSAALTTAAGASSADRRRLSTVGAAALLGRREGASPDGSAGGAGGSAAEGAGAGAGATIAEDGARGGSSTTGGGGLEVWGFEVEKGSAPKRLEEETALDAEIQHLRKRRREGLRRCAAMVRKRGRETAVLQDVNDYVGALQIGVSSSFDDNGLTPVPAKVQEAVQSSAVLRVTAMRAEELTRRLERQVQESAATGCASGGTGIAAPPPAPRDLQEVFQRSSKQQVVAGGAADYSALEARLRG